MRTRYWLAFGAGLGALTGLAVVGLAYLGEQALALPFIPFVFFDWLARVLPGGIVTLGIDSMVRIIVGLGLGPIDVVAKAMEQLLGVVLWLVAGAAVGLALAAWLRRPAAAARLGQGAGQQAGAIAGLALAVLVAIAMLGLGQFASGQPWTLLWLAILVPGWGAVLGTLLERVVTAGASRSRPEISMPAPRMGRRAFLLRVSGGSGVVALLTAGLGWLLAEDKARTGAGQPLGELRAAAAPPATPPGSAATGPAGSSPTAAAVPTVGAAQLPSTPAGRIGPAPGTRPEVTSNADFYCIDINLAPPAIAGSSWQLEVKGLFDHPRNLTLHDLLAMPAVTQSITQSCISNPIGGDLIGSAAYIGVRLRDVLMELGLRPTAKQIALQSADGFYESVEMQDMQDPRVLLVYGMNGTTLPIEHGYPLRIYIPNRYGMKQPKWITSMEAVDHEGSGYWVDRGWSKEARPQVISIIDTVAKNSNANGRVPMGGIAWAGDRGIKSVEVQVDGGSWSPANLITPPVGPLTWVLWRFDWQVTPGRHTFRVRATDGKGTPQNGQDQDTYPNGATGYHAVTVDF
jgi:DMSO/TMAO reductase YedYZ molybdopterin-dependent catalytic subunit